jgi:iron complex transport system ATP-binding protein
MIADLTGITYIRDAQAILRDISWQIARGQHWALLGANGSGKTTLLKVVTGYEWPSEGEVRVLGEHFGECNLPELRKTIGWVSSALLHQFPYMSRAVDVAASGLDASIGLYRDITESEWATARDALARVDLADLADRPYRLLSQGEQQRVLIARALVRQPALLILDEACAGLDPMAREHFLASLESLARSSQAPAMIFVTHHIEEIGPWITHVLVLKAGKVLAQGPKADILQDRVLTDAFGGQCKVTREGDRFYLRLSQ